MLDKNSQRMLAYIVTVDEIKPIPNYDRVEYARTHGWWCVVQKGTLHVGDKALYLEIDSLAPKSDKRFEFLAPKKYRIKTQKMCKVVSQGLLMPIDNFPELQKFNVGDDVTKVLGVTYYVKEDNYRKSNHENPNAKYNRMAARHPNLAKHKWFKWLMKRLWGRKLLYVFLGNSKKDEIKKFPSWIKKTDEDRIENCLWMFESKEPFVCTEKVDGTSTTVFLDTTTRKPDFGVCSRNIRQMDAEQVSYHTNKDAGVGNVYWEMVDKYDMKDALEDIAKAHDVKRVVLQGETYGEAIQKNPLHMKGRHFAAFNLIFDGERLGSLEAKKILDEYDIPFVPIIDDDYHMPDDFEELKLQADGKSVINPKYRREGFVYRSFDGKQSCKNVSREYLLKLKE